MAGPARDAIGEARPFLKWAGGKGKLAPRVLSRVPNTFLRYYEPFAGGAAVYFALWNSGRCASATLADANADLMECYHAVRDDVEALVKRLGELEDEHLALDGEGRRRHYYAIRARRFEDPVDRAARLIFLNRTGYNGLYRVNRAGTFNVPYGRYSNPRVLREGVTRACSAALQNVTLAISEFDSTCEGARAGDVVYFDPPYVPMSKTANFTQYAAGGFGPAEQARLRDCIEELTRRGVAVLLSNSDHDDVTALYGGRRFAAERVTMSRAINSAADRRQPVAELLIDNYGHEDVQASFDGGLPPPSSTRRPL